MRSEVTLGTVIVDTDAAVRVSFDTAERGSTARLERHDVAIFGDGRVQVFVFGTLVSTEGIAAVLGFAASPHPATSHGMAELPVSSVPGGLPVSRDPPLR